MKVFWILPTLNFGGVESYASRISDQGLSLRFDLTFISTNRDGPLKDEILRSRYRLSQIGGTGITFYMGVILYFLKIPSFYGQHYIVHVFGFDGYVIGGLLKLLLGRRLILVTHEIGIPQRKRILRYAVRRLLQHSSLHIVESDIVRHHIVQVVKEVPTSKVVKLYPPIDFLRILNPNSEPCPPRLITFCRLVPEKRLVELLRLFRSIPSNLYGYFVIYGDGPEVENISSVIKEVGLTNKVLLKGFVDFPYRKLRVNDIYIQPSITEGFGMSAAEALLSGVSVLTTPVGIFPELTGVPNLCISDSQLEDFIDKLSKLLLTYNEGGSKKLAEPSVELRTMFSLANFVHNLEKYYSEAIKSQNSDVLP